LAVNKALEHQFTWRSHSGSQKSTNTHHAHPPPPMLLIHWPRPHFVLLHMFITQAPLCAIAYVHHPAPTLCYPICSSPRPHFLLLHMFRLQRDPHLQVQEGTCLCPAQEQQQQAGP
jgi:hypothetical protein